MMVSQRRNLKLKISDIIICKRLIFPLLLMTGIVKLCKNEVKNYGKNNLLIRIKRFIG
jgi:hypothetical protein